MAKNKVSKPRARQERGLKTYDKLVKCAIQLLAESDMGQLRFSQISKITKIPQPLIDYHFPTLQALQLAMIQHELKKILSVSLLAIEKNQKNPRKALEAYILAPFHLAQRDKEFRAVWTGYYHLVTIHREIAMFNSTVQTNGRERVTNLINSILVSERLYLLKKKTAEDLSSSIQGIITGYSFMATTHIHGDFPFWAQKAVQDALALLDLATTSS
jgi:AcrR family transcriptional regulator